MYWSDEMADIGRADAAVAELGEDNFAATEFALSTHSGSVTLLAACDSGPNWVYSTASFSLAAGAYAVSKANYVAPDYEARVCRLLPVLEQQT